MRAWWLIALVGCDVPFDLKQVPPPDGPPACYSSKPFGTTSCRTAMFADIEDVYLAMETPTTPIGHKDALLVTASDPALFKFDVSTIQPGERISDVQLLVEPMSEAANCPTGSGMCLFCTNAVTEWRLSWATTSWSSSSATFQTRDGVTPWQMTDRGPTVIEQILTNTVVKDVVTTLEVTGDHLQVSPQTTPECWIDDMGVLGIELVMVDQAAITSRYHGGCTGDSPALLRLTLCTDD